jgi:hypothetical protein
MNEHDDFFRHYLNELAGSHPEDAWHSLVEYGPEVLPDVRAACERTQDVGVRCLLMGIMAELRDEYSIELLATSLGDSNAHAWKAALDAIVAIGGSRAIAALQDAKVSARPEQLEWIEEALVQAKATL